MTQLAELKAKLKDIVEIYKDNFGVCIHIVDDETGEHHLIGNDCPVCVYADLQQAIKDGKIEHLDKRRENESRTYN